MGKTVGKVLGVVATVGAVLLAIPTGGASLGGLSILGALVGSQVAAAAIVVAASIGATLLAPKPKAARASPATSNRLSVSLNPYEPRGLVFGRTAMHVALRDQEFSGENDEFIHRFIVHAAHRVNSIEQIWFDETLAWDSTAGVTADFAGYLTVTTCLEGDHTNAINLGARMGNSRRYTGCAYTYFKFKLSSNNPDDEDEASPFQQSIPTRMTVIGEGMLCYDPRKDSTVPGGSGSHRASDQATWTWGQHCLNPACQLATWMLGWKINGKLSVGKGIPPDRIDWPSFIDSANLCDEPVVKVDSSTEPRYLSGGVFTEADDPTAIVQAFKDCMNADLDDQDGLLRLTVFHNDLALPVASFTDDDIQGEYTWLQTPALSDGFNVVRGTYIDSSDEALYQPMQLAPVELGSPDGIDRIQTNDYGLVQSKSQGERLNKQRLQRQQYGGLFRATFLATGWRVQKNSVIRLTFSREAFNDKLFRVVETTVQQNGLVPMLLREEHENIYAWDKEEKPVVVPAAPVSYDDRNSPINQRIDHLATNFNSLNDFNTDPVAAPTIPGGGVAIDHTISTSGDANISFEWLWSGDEAVIDGFQIMVRQSTSSSAYTPGATPVQETVIDVPAHKRAFIVYGAPADLYYTFAVRAYRRVDPSVDSDGLIASSWVKSTVSGENPYRPASNVAFDGDVIGTINGLPVEDITGTVKPGTGILPNKVDTLSLQPGTVKVTSMSAGGDTVVNPGAGGAGNIVTVLETGFITVGDATDGGALAIAFCEIDTGTQRDCGGRIYLDADVGGGYSQVATCAAGARTVSGDTYLKATALASAALGSVASVRWRLRVGTFAMPGASNAFGFTARAPQIVMFGGKR